RGARPRRGPALSSRAPRGRRRRVSAAPTDLGVAGLRRLLRARETTAAAVAEAHLARLGTLDGDAHAFVAVIRDEALVAAAAADRPLGRGTAGPLAGGP